MSVSNPSVVYNYVKTAIMAFYNKCGTAILCNPDLIKFEKNGITTVFQPDAANAGDYSGNWATSGAQNDRDDAWVAYEADFDRAWKKAVDYKNDLNLRGEGMDPIVLQKFKVFAQKYLPAEIDAANIAKYYGQLAAGNKLTAGDGTLGTVQIDKSHILDTINDIEAKIFDAGCEEDIVLFMAISVP